MSDSIVSPTRILIKKLFIVCIVCIFLGISIFLRLFFLTKDEMHIREVVSSFQDEKVDIVGMVDEDPEIKSALQSFTIRTTTIGSTVGNTANNTAIGTPIRTRILVNTKLYPQYVYGELLKLSGKLASPRNFSDSSDDPSADPKQFDYVHYLSKDGIFYILKNPVITTESSVGGNSFGNDAGNDDENAKNVGNPLFRLLYRFKDSFLDNIKRVLGEPQASLAGGLVVGEKSALGKTLLDDFRRSGLIHVVILSGYSINIIAGSVRSLLSFLPRTASLFLSGFGIVLFGILVGGKATVIRACAMAIVGIVAKLFYRDYNALRALLLVGYLMVVQNPYIVRYDASFQVSFVSTLGLILFGTYIEKILARFPRLFTERFGIRSLITSTLATQISVAPLLLYMMGDASLVGVFANILVLPLIPITMITVFTSGMLGFVTFAGYFSLASTTVAYVLLSYQLFIVHFFANIPYGVFEMREFTAWMMWLVYAGYAIVYFLIKTRKKRQKDSSRSPPS